ncbi:MAG: MucB/RseB C-terminal domain-containing protein [Sulfuricaulis sp.]|uniref:MucB/RseB C-terminal domain-containing protein n=1 Tax=Sulfuricaulis sp. TaxID=2003553 RepID=UPI003C4581A4
MISRLPDRSAFIFLGLFVCSTAMAADAAHEWLMKINHAASALDYEGIFVYQHDKQLETMQIFHKVENNSSRERLMSLNGAPREIVRDANEVRCYWPDKNSVMVEYRKAEGKAFPSILPERLQDLDEYYTLTLGNTERITGRVAQLVIIKPTDQYRYGYRLWADVDSGLLLKADLLDNQDAVLEQFMFTQVNIGAKIPASALAPGMTGKSMVWYREDGDTRNVSDKPGWSASQLPKGFRLSAHMTRRLPMRKQPVEHLVYTDGLAAVSVFIEKQEKGVKPFMQGPSRMGAVHAMSAQSGDYQITTVGEVPAATVAFIGGSVSPVK